MFLVWLLLLLLLYFFTCATTFSPLCRYCRWDVRIWTKNFFLFNKFCAHCCCCDLYVSFHLNVRELRLPNWIIILILWRIRSVFNELYPYVCDVSVCTSISCFFVHVPRRLLFSVSYPHVLFLFTRQSFVMKRATATTRCERHEREEEKTFLKTFKSSSCILFANSFRNAAAVLFAPLCKLYKRSNCAHKSRNVNAKNVTHDSERDTQQNKK